MTTQPKISAAWHRNTAAAIIKLDPLLNAGRVDALSLGEKREVLEILEDCAMTGDGTAKEFLRDVINSGNYA